MEEIDPTTPIFSPSTSIVVITFIFTALLCWYIYKAAHVTKLICAGAVDFRSRRIGLTLVSSGITILVLFIFLMSEQRRMLTEKMSFRTDNHEEVTLSSVGLCLLYLTPLVCGIGNVVLLADSFLQWWTQASQSDPGHWTRGIANVVTCVTPWLLVRLFAADCLCDCHRTRFRTYSAACAMLPACLVLVAAGVYMCTVKKRVIFHTS
ncbi:hypothetical protein PoB_005184100 [Plakobranchus ocellatus]|uniref:Uncharacterized protein n=1 Tax=Plakobranchus ocellatus TaxID=259542 RepID=A0AAV4C1T3_9GAST|nr:hypothetical protein PoB_005184100 [Plakobranchus ocellatus]